jgi:MFS family permease
MTTWFSATAVIPQVTDDWGLTRNERSLLTIAVQVGFVLGAVVSATLNLSDVLPPRSLLFWSALGAALANLITVFADGAEAAVPLRVLTGFFLAGVYPVALKLVATWYREGRGTALGIMVGALTIGSAMPHLVNGLGGIGWQAVIATTSGLTLAGALLTMLLVREGPFPFPVAVFDPRQAGKVFANRAVRLASLGYFGHMWELYAMWAWFLAFFTSRLDSSGVANSDQLAALATFAVIGVGAVGCYVGGVLGDSWGRTKTTSAAMGVSGACCVIVSVFFNAPAVIVLLIGLVWGVAVVADSAQFSTIVSEVAEQAYVGTALTLQLAVGFSLTVVTIWLVPVLESEVGWRWTFVVLAPGPLLGIVAMMVLLASPERRLIADGKG